MNYRDLLQKGDEHIRDIVEKYNNFDLTNQNLSSVEVDLFLDEIKQLYETFKKISLIILSENDIKLDNSSINENKDETIDNEIKNENIDSVKETTEEITNITEEEVSPLIFNDKVETENNIKQEFEEFQPNLFSQSFRGSEESKIVNKEETKEENHPQSNDSKMIGESFTSNSPSINDVLNKSSDYESITYSSRVNSIKNIASAVSLHEKYTFISELFENNSQKYEESIARLNNAVNYDEAMWIFDSLRKDSWEDYKETVSLLKDYVHRRFI